MTVHEGEIKGTEWPSILDGERTDRGWEHYLVPTTASFGIAISDDAKIRLVVPLREVWIVEYLAWEWGLGDPVWSSGKILRNLNEGMARTFPPAADWAPMNALAARDRTLYSIPSGEEVLGNVGRAGLVTDVGGLRPGARWGFDFLGATAAVTSALSLRLLVVRIPLAKQRNWTKLDLANALTRIEELGRRVS